MKQIFYILFFSKQTLYTKVWLFVIELLRAGAGGGGEAVEESMN